MGKEYFERLSFEEFNEIAKNLMAHHGIFYKLWDIVKPSFTNSKKYPTACVVFNKQNDCVDFVINKKFWLKLNQEQKNFIICHECLHVILEHGKRASSINARLNPEIVNACLDIPINEMLTKYFGFNRKNVDPKNKFCWANTVFKKEKLPDDQSYEFYFNKLKENSEVEQVSMCGMGSGEGGEGLETNSHDYLESFDSSFNEKIEEIVNELSDEEKESLKDISDRMKRNDKSDSSKNNGKIAGNNTGGLSKIVGKIKVKPKKKWETVIKKWSLKFSRSERDESHWLAKSRRNSLINSSFFIPSEIENDIKRAENQKIDVWMLLDTSGSCYNLADRFWKASKSLPKEKFNVRFHCFDTTVYPLNDKDIKTGKLYGFGGTSFSCIEAYIKNTIKKENKKYPAAVFVITDGFGDAVKPENPKKWYWFLSEDYQNYIPKESHVFMLKDFE